MLRRWVGARLAHYLSKPRQETGAGPTSPPALLARVMRPGDVLLVEGTSRFSEGVKYLTQSTWSHAALYAGEGWLLEADVSAGVRRLSLTHYDSFHTRICRPVGLSASEIDTVIRHVVGRLGHQYDVRHIVDLARYLIPAPPVPVRWRRRLLTLGSGDPSRAICSSLIAEAFQAIQYPILPYHRGPNGEGGDSHPGTEVLERRHPSLFTPRDFDVSPYFAVIKPRLSAGFDPHRLNWHRPYTGAGGPPTADSDEPTVQP